MLESVILDLTYRSIRSKKDSKERWLRNHSLRSMLIEAYKVNDIVECEVRLRSLCWCATAFGITFVCAPIPRRYKKLTEKIFSNHGLVLIYEDLQVLEDGGLLKRGFRIGGEIPSIESNEFLRLEYKQWLKTKYKHLSSDSKIRIIDKWRTFIIDLVREIP